MNNPHQQRYRLGQSAEWLCRLLLRVRGYSVLASRLNTPLGEIDIVAAKGDVIAIIEVKARAERDAALGAVSDKQQDRLRRAATWFISQNPRYGDKTVRFDLMAVAPWQWPTHIMDAWQ
jgi:putative endonuclease